MAVTDKKVNFKFSNLGASAADTASTGDIIFDKKNKKIYARGEEWDCSGSGGSGSGGSGSGISFSSVLGNILILTDNNVSRFTSDPTPAKFVYFNGVNGSTADASTKTYYQNLTDTPNFTTPSQYHFIDLAKIPEINTVIISSSMSKKIVFNFPSFLYVDGMSEASNISNDDVECFAKASKYASVHELGCITSVYDPSINLANGIDGSTKIIPSMMHIINDSNQDVLFCGLFTNDIKTLLGGDATRTGNIQVGTSINGTPWWSLSGHSSKSFGLISNFPSYSGTRTSVENDGFFAGHQISVFAQSIANTNNNLNNLFGSSFFWTPLNFTCNWKTRFPSSLISKLSTMV